MANATLQAIRDKVRRLTRAISTNQISNADIDEYINTFIAFDMPEHLRLFTLRKTLTFYTEPNVDTYETTSLVATDPLFDFKNNYITIHGPIYIAGYQAMLSQSREQFFNIFPQIQVNLDTGLTGDGVTLAFAGTIPGIASGIPGGNVGSAIMPGSVTFNSIGAANDGLVLKDIPQDNESGDLVVPDTVAPLGLINYLTGVFNLAFPIAPSAQQPINVLCQIYQPSRPQALLYYENKFTLRPVPDQVYPVNMEAYVKPTELMAANERPELDQWWQYIAYGAAKKVFEDRMDLESVQMILPEFKMQERLVLRRTLAQNANKRASTIYTNQLELGGARGWNYWGLY